MPGTLEALQRLLVAMLVGLLIGVDRERAEERKQHKQFAGVRTFPLIAGVGAGLALLRAELGVAPLVAGFVAVAAIIIVAYQASCRAGQVGATTELAALLTFVVGALAGSGQLIIAGATGVTVAVLLATKPRIERLSRAMTEQELAAVLQLAVISVIVLPLLPDRGLGPWQVWNPFKIWLVVVLVSAVSFAGFVAVRWKGERAGLYWAGALGALVSSTATTAAMAQRSRATPERVGRISVAAILASTVMCVRLLAVVAAVRPQLLALLAPPMGAMAVVGLAVALLLHRKAGGERRQDKVDDHEDAELVDEPEDDAEDEAKAIQRPTAAKRAQAGRGRVQRARPERKLGNPFSLRSAITFGLLFAFILLLVKAADVWLGDKGTFLAALLAGLVDVDAISIALARSARGDHTTSAVLGIVLACASNNLFKAGIAVFAGGGAFRRNVALTLLAMAAAGVAVAAAMSWARLGI